MSDIRRLLEKMDTMSNAEKRPAGPKFPGYWKGTDPASKAKDKMVGGAEESIIKELHKTSKSKTTEWTLEEDWKQFKEQDLPEPEVLDKVSDKPAAQELPKPELKPAAPTPTPTITPTPAPAAPPANLTKPNELAKSVMPGAEPAKVGAPKNIYNQVKDVAAASGIKNPDLILPGQKIKLPAGGEYTVAKGDTLSGILQRQSKGDSGVLGGKVGSIGLNKPAAPEKASDVLGGRPGAVGLNKPAAGTSTAGAGRGVQGGPTADELAAAGKATITKSVTEPEPAKPAPAVTPAAPAYTGIDPIVRKRLGMAPATSAEIEAFKKANPATVRSGSGAEVTSGSGAPVQAGGQADVEKAAKAAAPTTPAQPAQAPGATMDFATANKLITGAESGGNSNLSFGDSVDKSGNIVPSRLDPKTGKIVGRKDPAYANAVPLLTPEKFSGKKLSDMTIGEVQAFQAARNKQLPGSSAVGQYQFIAGTLDDYAKKLGFGPDTPFNADTQQRLQNALLADNSAYLKKQGVEPTPVNLYMAHVAGMGGAVELNRAKQTNPNAPAADVLAQQYAQGKKFAGDPVKQQAAFAAKRDQLIRLNPFLAKPVKDLDAVLSNKLSKGSPSKVSESVDNFVEDFKNFINGVAKPVGQSFGKMLRRINKDEQVAEFQNRQSPDAQITSPPAPAATKASQFTADMDIIGNDDQQATMEAGEAGAQDPSQQTTSPASPVKQAVNQQQAAQKKVQDARQDMQTALGTVSSIKPYLSPKTDVNKVASAITKIADNQPLTQPESQAVSSLTPLVMKAAETPTSAAALKTALTTAGVLGKQGK
jgi:hypothetical protein